MIDDFKPSLLPSMDGTGSLSNIFSYPVDVVWDRSSIRRSRSITLPQFEISVFDMGINTFKKVGLSLQNFPVAAFSSLSKGVEEESEENLSDRPPSSVILSDFFLEECPALLSQVPDSFDLGRTRVRLNLITASARHIAIGSECGALFLFNRRIGQSVKPLRTEHSEVISAMEFCSNGRDGSELLAIGHRSGKTVILSLPSAATSNQKLLQHVQDEAHRHSAVLCFCWSFDGRVLFSGDALGMVLATHVDFTNAQFPIAVVENGTITGGKIVAMISSGPYFAFAKGRKCKVCNWQKDSETVAEVTAQKEIVGIHLLRSNAFDQLSLLQSDGTICRKNVTEKDATLVQLGLISCDLFDGEEMRVVPFSDSDGPSWALWAQKGVLQTCCLREGFAVEKMALEGRLDQVLSVCASSSLTSPSPFSDEFFLLCSSTAHPLQQRRRIFRLSRLSPAHPSLTVCSPTFPNGHSLLFGYLYGTVEKAVGELGRLKNAAAGYDGTETRTMLPQGTEELLGRLNRELDFFLMGNNGAKGGNESGNCKTANTLADFLPEFGSVFPEGTTKIATGLHQMFGQLRQQSSNLFSMPTDDNSFRNLTEHPSKSSEIDDFLSMESAATYCENTCQMRERTDSPAKMSLPSTEFSCSAYNDGEFGHLAGQLSEDKEKERGKVRVERKKIVMRRKKTKKREESEGRHQKEDESTLLADMKGTTEEGEGAGEWTPGAVTDERQQLILEELGIVPKPTMLESDSIEVSQRQQMGFSNYDSREVNGGQLAKRVNGTPWQRREDSEADDSQLTDLQINIAKGYSFPPTSDGHLLEDEEPPIVPSVSLADLIALFPPPSLPYSSISPPLPSSARPLLSPSSSSPSFTFSSSASSSVFTVHPSPLYQSLLRLSPDDQWRRLDVPFTVSNFTLCRHYIIVCPGNKRSTKSQAAEKQRPHYLMATLLEDEGAMDEWVPLRVSASALSVNDEGTLLWRMHDGVAYSPCSPPDPICPSTTLSRTTAWMEMSNQFEGTIVQIALNSQNAWFLADTGRTRKERTVWVQMFLPEMGIFHRAVDEDNRHFFTQLAVSDHSVWTLSGGLVVARVGLKLDLAPMGLDWADIDGQPRKFVAIALYEHTGFGLERNGNIWFVHGVAESAPFGHGPWFKVCFPPEPSSFGLSQLSPPSEWRLHVGTPGIFIVAGSVVFHTNVPLIGSHFGHIVPDRLVLNDHFALITATGFCGLNNECLFLCQPSSGELFSFSLRKRHFTSLPPYCSDLSAKIQCLSSTNSCLFVLDKSGNLYVRYVGLDTEGNGGRMFRQWARVQLPNTESLSEVSGHCVRHNASPVKLVSVATCSSSIWTVSDDGSIWASRSLDPSSSFNMGSPDIEPIGMSWIKVEGPPDGEAIDQVRVSPSGHFVWLFSELGLCWYRTDVTDRNWMGLQWTTSKAIQSIRINELAVGDSAVWALANETGQLYRLCSIGWQAMGVRLKALSVDALESRLWALDNEFRIVRHEMDVVSHSPSVALFDYSEFENRENVAPWRQRIPSARKIKEMRQQVLSNVSNISAENVRWAFNFKKMFSFFR